MDFNKLIARVKGILLTPKTEWPVIAAEQTTVADLYKGYIVWLAAIAPIFSFLAMARFAPGFALRQLVLGYLLTLGLMYVMALITDALAPTFGGTRDRVQGLKTVAYASTATCVAGVAAIVPILGTLIGIAVLVYAVYLLYLGLPHTMKSPPDRAGGYTAVLVVIMLVVGVVLAGVIGAVTGAGMYSRGGSLFSSSRDPSATTFDKDSKLGKLEQWSKQVEAASKKMEQAQKSGDQQAQGDAMKNMMGTVLGGGGAVESLQPDRLKPFLPESLGDMTRSTFSTERNAAMGMQMTEARATYMNDSGRQWNLEITDTGSAKGLIALAGWAGIEGESESATGFDKTYRENGRLVHEQWDSSSSHGQYGIVIGERFAVKIEGQADSIDDLKAALADLDLDSLEAMKGEGVAKN
ncbi:MAG TPA: Yip1 family protein [Steroidobacteraceae bacterium]|nr:Yip1 family protein [Steroidobacteraceae bacterium]